MLCVGCVLDGVRVLMEGYEESIGSGRSVGRQSGILMQCFGAGFGVPEVC